MYYDLGRVFIKKITVKMASGKECERLRGEAEVKLNQEVRKLRKT